MCKLPARPHLVALPSPVAGDGEVEQPAHRLPLVPVGDLGRPFEGERRLEKLPSPQLTLALEERSAETLLPWRPGTHAIANASSERSTSSRSIPRAMKTIRER